MQALARSGAIGRGGVSHDPTSYPSGAPQRQRIVAGVVGVGQFKWTRAVDGDAKLTWVGDSVRSNQELPKPSTPSKVPGVTTPLIRRTGPVQFVDRLLTFWNLTRADAAPLLGFRAEDADYVDDVLNGLQPLRGRDPLDRIASLYRIRELLAGIFRDLEVENEWLREPHKLLDGRTPLSLLMGPAIDLELAKDYTETFAGL